jgi:hypothetical protein
MAAVAHGRAWPGRTGALRTADLADLAAVGVGRGQADYVLPLLACSDARLRDGPGVRHDFRLSVKAPRQPRMNQMIQAVSL